MANHFPLAPQGYRVDDVDAFVAQVHERMQVAIERFRKMEAELELLRRQNAALLTAPGNAPHPGAVGADAAALLADARREADGILERAHAEARELIVNERARVADELEMLIAVREQLAHEREGLLADAPSAAPTYAPPPESEFDQPPPPSLAASFDQPQPPAASSFDQPPPPYAAAVELPPPPAPGAPFGIEFVPLGQPLSGAPSYGASNNGAAAHAPAAPFELYADDDDDDLLESYVDGVDPLEPRSRDEAYDAAFESFFESDVEVEPSRDWILGGQ